MIPYTQQELRQLFRYNKKTGALRWRIRPSQAVLPGDLAGTLHPQGYIMVHFHGKNYAAHRLIWKMQYGEEPDVVDHKNGIRHDNRQHNLRSVSRTENLQLHRKARKDSTTGLLGVRFRKDCGKYQAKLRRNGVTTHLGTFSTPEEAHAAYMSAKRGGKTL